MADGDNLAKEYVEESKLPEYPVPQIPEYCKYGEFTGTFVGLTCADRVLHKHYADFDFFSYEADEEKGMQAPEEK